MPTPAIFHDYLRNGFHADAAKIFDEWAMLAQERGLEITRLKNALADMEIRCELRLIGLEEHFKNLLAREAELERRGAEMDAREDMWRGCSVYSWGGCDGG